MAEDRRHTGNLLLGTAVGWGLYELVKRVIKPNVIEPIRLHQYVERIRIGKIYAVKFKDDTVQFKFPIENPNNKPMTVDAIVGDVYASDRRGQRIKLGTINHYGHNVINPLAATDFDLVVRIKLVNEFIYLSKMLQGNWRGQAFTFIGTVNANGRPWPVKETIVVA